jgi:hypothetical protein
MKRPLLSGLLLSLIAACDQSAQRNDTPKANYEPTEFIKTFNSESILNNGWVVNSRSEEKRIYGGEAGSYRRGKVVFTSEALGSESISDEDIKNAFSTAPGFRVITAGTGSKHQFDYGVPGSCDGAIVAFVVQSGNEVIVSYELTEKP